jgi:hypothetical protein
MVRKKEEQVLPARCAFALRVGFSFLVEMRLRLGAMEMGHFG